MQVVMFHKRLRDEEGSSDEDCAAVAMLCIRKRRLNAQLSLAFLEASVHMINAYVDYRGGINALLNFELSEPTFDFDTCCDKRFAQWFRFSKANVTQIIHLLVTFLLRFYRTAPCLIQVCGRKHNKEYSKHLPRTSLFFLFCNVYTCVPFRHLNSDCVVVLGRDCADVTCSE